MRFPRIYCPPSIFDLCAGTQLELSTEFSKRICRVLRLNVDDCVTLFNGKGGEYTARIEQVRGNVVLDVISWHNVECESPVDITLFQALQSADKMDYTLQKSVELGVSTIVPLSSQRSVLRLKGERANKRVEHWRKVVVSAVEQCGRNCLPLVSDIQSLSDCLNSLKELRIDELRLLLLPAAQRSLVGCVREFSAPITKNNNERSAAIPKISILIGAEGGFEPEEEEMAIAAGFIPVSLGPRVLRTETAALSALSVLQALQGDF